MRYLILLFLIFFMISGKVYSKKTTCRELLKNDMTLGMTQMFFWSTYRGYIFGKTGEKLDNPDKVVSKRIPKYIRRVCRKDKKISVYDEMLFKGLEDDFKIKTKTNLTIESLLLDFDSSFKKEKLRKCWIKNLSEMAKNRIKEYLPELEDIENKKRERMLKKLSGISVDKLFEVDKIEEKCKQYF